MAVMSDVRKTTIVVKPWCLIVEIDLELYCKHTGENLGIFTYRSLPHPAYSNRSINVNNFIRIVSNYQWRCRVDFFDRALYAIGPSHPEARSIQVWTWTRILKCDRDPYLVAHCESGPLCTTKLAETELLASYEWSVLATRIIEHT
jgi:hypothetical protein